MHRSSIACVVSLFCVGIVHESIGQTVSSIEPLVLDWEQADWGPPSSARPGFPVGIRNAPAGSQFTMHWHTYTETVVVLQGTVSITLDGAEHTATEGSYIIIPGKAHHEWRVPEDADVVLLARRDGPADFFFVEP